MKVVQIDPELFLFKLDTEQFKFFRKNRNTLKKMWTNQGSTYWLRFLLTFQISFEDYVSNHIKLGAFIMAHYERRIADFVYIRIHKQFIEATYDKVESFIENVFRIVQNFHKASHSYTENALFSEESFENFSSAMEQDENEKVTYSGIVSLLCIMYCGFVDGVLKLLKKWQKETEVSYDNKKEIDLTIYYWRPQKNWECKKFTPSCFEKYLAVHWAESLPKLLLTCNVHNIFSIHAEKEECSCRFKEEESLFGLLKDKYKVGKPSGLSVVNIYKPETALCRDHNNCNVKIRHGRDCLEPYICIGETTPCIRSCETFLKTLPKKVDMKDYWQKSIVEVFNCKKENKRNVSTHVESCDSLIETYFPVYNAPKKKQVSLDLEELFYCTYDSNFRNAYTQHKRKEEYRQKLRRKLQEKYEYDSQDPAQLKDMYDEAQRLWLNEICFENYRELFSLQPNPSHGFDQHLFRVKKSLTTVAIGTSSVIFGRVVIPRKTDCNAEISGSNSKLMQTNTKKRKKKSVVAATSSEIGKVKIISESVTISKINVTSPEIRENETITLNNSGKLLETNCDQNLSPASEIINEIKISSNSNIKSNDSDAKSKSETKYTKSPFNFVTETSSDSDKLLKDKIDLKTKLGECCEQFNELEKICLGVGETCNQYKSIPNYEESCNKVQLVETEPCIGEISGDDDELNTFYSFVVNGEEKINDETMICNGTTIDQLMSADCNTTAMDEAKGKERKGKLKICAYCSKKEAESKSFKRCSRCKAENLPDQYFYCSRDCQVADWEISHRELHLRARTNI